MHYKSFSSSRSPRSLTVDCPAKINLYLNVRTKRPDGFHELETVFERINLCDKIVLRPLASPRIEVTSDSPGLPDDASNLAFRSAKLIRDTCRVTRGVSIRILKRIPIGAGLGGGSSDAAGVLRGLNALWKLNLSTRALVSMAKKLGSDAAFFIYDVPFAAAGGRGDVVRPLSGLKGVRLWHVLVVPNVHVSTPVIYAAWDSHARLTSPQYNAKLLILRLKKGLPLAGGALFNSLAPVTARLYPEVTLARNELSALGVEAVLMSGSGPAVFGIVPARKEAVALRKRLLERHSSWRVFVARTV